MNKKKLTIITRWFHSPERLWNLSAGQSQKGSTALKGLWSQRFGVLGVAIALLIGSYYTAANFGFFSGGTNAPSVPEDTMTRGLVGYWEFDEGTGQTAYDGSDSSNNGQLGSTTSSDDNDPVWSKGKNGGGMEFDGVDDYVDAGNDSSLDITEAITVEAWVYPSSITGSFSIVTKRASSATNNYMLYFANDQLRFRIYTTAQYEAGVGIPSLQTNQWQHIVGIYDGSNISIYVDGVQKDTQPASGNMVTTSINLIIGKDSSADQYYFNGSIDSVRIYNRALSADEVRYHYNRGGPVGSWNFDEGSGLTAFDSTSNNNDGTLKSSGLEFDGVDDYVDCGSGSSLQISGSDAEITLEAWVYPKHLYAGATYGYVMNKGVEYYITAWNSLWKFGVRDSTGAYIGVTSDSVYTVNTWYHLVGVLRNDVLYLYINSVEKVGTSADGLYVTTNDLIIGTSGSNYIEGNIDEVRIYNTALSAAEIARHYNGDFSQDPTANLVLLQHFEEGMVCDANDEAGCLTDDSPSGTNDGTLKNFDNLTAWDNGTDGWISEVKKPEWRWVDGKYKTAGEFNGWDDYIEVADNDSLDMGTQITTEAWIYMTGGSERRTIASKWSSYFFEIVSDKLNVYLYGTTDLGWHISNTTVQSSTWQHVAFVYDGANVKFYINGIEDSNKPATSGDVTDTITSLVIGNTNLYEQTRAFNGSIDDVRIYDYARTADEIRLDYNAGVATHLGPSGKTCSEDPAGCMDYGLVGSWGMDEGTGTTAYDGSDNSNDGTLTNGPKWTADSSPLAGGGGSLKFDGVDDYISVPDHPSLDIANGWTSETWIKAQTFSGGTDRCIMGLGATWSSLTDGFVIMQYSSGGNYYARVAVVMLEGGWAIPVSAQIPIDTWTHVAVTGKPYDAVKIYVNGVEKGNASYSYGFINPSAGVFIGATHQADLKFNGSIDSVRIYNRALSAEEVRYHYNKGGPVAEWKFDEGSGTTAFDSMGNNNDGTLTNMNDSDWIEGKFDTALDFDGSNDHVNCGNDSSLNQITSGLSLSFWMKGNDSVRYGTMISTTDLLADENGYAFGYNDKNVDNKVRFYFDRLGSTKQVASTSSLADGTWYFLSGTYDGDIMKIYIDGILENSKSGVVLQANTKSLIIGDVSTSADWSTHFKGSLDSVRIYPYARTADEILLDYNAGVATHLGPSGKTCSEDPAGCMDYGLVGSWGMDEGTGTTAYDGSDNSNDGTLTNGPTWTTDSSPLAGGGGSLKFDGVGDYVDCGSGSSLDDMGPLTYSAWIYPITIDTTARYICGKCVNGGGYNRHLYLQSIGGNPRIHFVVNGATSLDVSSVDNAVVENEWQHIIITWDGNTTATNAHIYVNGIEVSYAIQSNGSGLISDANGDFIIGNRGDTIRPFNGSIDSVRIYNRALSAEEVRYHYNKGGPVAEWKFDEGSGQTAFDESFNNNDGTLGATAGVEASDPTWVEGKYGGALSFDGGDWVDCGNDESLDITEAITVGAWVKPNGTQPLNSRVVFKGDGTATWSFGLTYDATGKLMRLLTYTTGTVTSISAAEIISSQWYHIVGVYNGSSQALYIDGVLIDSDVQSGSLRSAANLIIGSEVNPTVQYFNGSIDSVRIYNYARTPSQIQQDYNAGVATHFK